MSIYQDTNFISVALQNLPPLLVFSNVSIIRTPSCMALGGNLPLFEDPKETTPELNNIIVPVPTLGLVGQDNFKIMQIFLNKQTTTTTILMIITIIITDSVI